MNLPRFLSLPVLPLVVLLLAAPFGRAAAPASITLRPSAQLSSSPVRLGDVATVAAADPAARQRLVSLELGSLPRAGEVVVLPRTRIASWTAARLGAGALQWGGAESVRVTAAATVLEGERVRQAALAAMREWLAARGDRGEVQAPERVPDVALPAGERVVQARLPNRLDAPPRHLQVWVDVLVGGRLVRALPVRLDVRDMRMAWVAKQGIARGARLTDALVEQRELDVAGMPGLVGAAELRAQHYRLRHVVAAAQPLRRADLEPEPAVARGGWATLHGQSGAVSLERQVQVLQDGQVGQMVLVRALGANNTLDARVSGPSQVEMIE